MKYNAKRARKAKRKAAALAKDYIETCKGDPQKWQQLTVECSDIQKEMAHRYVRHPLINGKQEGGEA